MTAGLVKNVAVLGSSGLTVLSSCFSFFSPGLWRASWFLGLSGIRAWSFYGPRLRGFILGFLCSQGVTLG